MNQRLLKLTTFGLLLILLTTLYPFRFFEAEGIVPQILHGFLRRQSSWRDGLSNIVLFLPFGFGLAGLIADRRPFKVPPLASSLPLVGAVVASGCLSLTVELLQVFLPLRASSLTDVITNTLGGALGGLCFQWQGNLILHLAEIVIAKLRGVCLKLPLNSLFAAFLGYLILASGVAVALFSHSLSNWSPSMPLWLGNDPTGMNPWQGTIAAVQIAQRIVTPEEATQLLNGRALSDLAPDSLVASYTLRGGDRVPDDARQSPDLVWQGQTALKSERAEPLLRSELNGDHWLTTAEPATAMLETLRQASEFTLWITLAPSDTSTTKLAHIFSIAALEQGYNLILAQSGPHLLFWLRTSLHTRQPGLIRNGRFSGVFQDRQPQHLVFTYAGSVAQLYTASHKSQPYAVTLTEPGFRVLWLGLTFAPPGVLLALLARRYRRCPRISIGLIVGGVFVPPLLLEGLLATVTHRAIQRSNVLLAVLIMLSALLLLGGQRLFVRKPRKLFEFG